MFKLRLSQNIIEEEIIFEYGLDLFIQILMCLLQWDTRLARYETGLALMNVYLLGALYFFPIERHEMGNGKMSFLWFVNNIWSHDSAFCIEFISNIHGL